MTDQRTSEARPEFRSNVYETLYAALGRGLPDDLTDAVTAIVLDAYELGRNEGFDCGSTVEQRPEPATPSDRERAVAWRKAFSASPEYVGGVMLSAGIHGTVQEQVDRLAAAEADSLARLLAEERERNIEALITAWNEDPDRDLADAVTILRRGEPLPAGPKSAAERAIEVMTRDFRCADCGRTMTDHVYVTRCECGESYTGPPIRYLLEGAQEAAQDSNGTGGDSPSPPVPAEPGTIDDAFMLPDHTRARRESALVPASIEEAYEKGFAAGVRWVLPYLRELSKDIAARADKTEARFRSSLSSSKELG